MEEGTGKHRLYHCPEWHAVRRDVPESFRKWEQKARTSKKEWKWQSSMVAQWESEKHRSWSMPVEGFNSHVATDGSLLGRTVKWRACGWAVVQLVYDEEVGPLHGMYGSVEAEVEVQRPAHHQEGGADGLLLPFNRVVGQSRSMLTTRELSIDYEKEKVKKANSGRC